MHRDVIFGAVTLAIAAAYFAAAAAIPRSGLADAIGPGGLPRIYGVVLAILSITLIVRPWLARRGRRMDPADSGILSWRAAALLGIGAVYVALVQWLGYPVLLAILILASIYAQRTSVAAGGEAARIPFPRAAITAVVGAAVFWIVFVLLLGVPQPGGVWAPQ